MRIRLWSILIIVCLIGAIVLTACNEGSAARRAAEEQQAREAAQRAAEEQQAREAAQRAADEAVVAQTALTADYTFSDVTNDGETRDGDADMYIRAHAEGGDHLIYVYQDIYYGEGEQTDLSYRYIDVYMPTAKDRLDPNTPVFLYLHGGGWVSGSRRDEQLSLMPYIAAQGMVAISMEYALWFGLNQAAGAVRGVYTKYAVDPVFKAAKANDRPVSVNDMLGDISACLTFLRDTYLPSLGLTCTNVGIGGYSAGGHLSSLYAYKCAAQSPMPLAYLLDLVGPVKLLDEHYLHLLDLVTGRVLDENGEQDTAFDFIWPDLAQMGGALAGIVGADHSLDIFDDADYATAKELIATLQPIDYLTSSSLPTIICYARNHDEDANAFEILFECEFDDFIPITVYEAISAKLDEVGIVHADILYDDLTHNTIGRSQKSDKWMAAHVAAYSQLYCRYE